MSKQTINVGSAPNDGTGDPARTAFTKTNDNFTELYAGTNPNLAPANALGALAIDTSKRMNTKSVSVDSTFTFSGAPSAGTWFSLLVTNSDISLPHTLTIPSSYSVAQQIAVTSVVVPVNGKLLLQWYYTGSIYVLFGEQVGITNNGFSVNVGIGSGVANAPDFSVNVGYGAGSNQPSAGQEVSVGYAAGQNPGGYAGTFVGYQAGKAGGGTSAVAIGYSALATADTGGVGNVAIGVHAAETVTTSGGMISIGYHSLNGAGTTTNAVAIGDHAGAGVSSVLNCIFLGAYAGVSRAHTLWIEGQGTSIGSHIPLIYGQFDNDAATINGSLRCGTPAANTVAAAGAALEVVSTTLAFRPPRMTKAQADAISGKVAGDRVTITDATVAFGTIAFGAAITGSGANSVPAVYSGSAWLAG